MKTFLTLFLTLSLSLFANSDAPDPKIQLKAAQVFLEAEPHTVAVYVKGLCCSSCGIGIRKKISKLLFTDTSRFSKGVKLDTKNHLAIISIKKGFSVTPNQLTQAISDAGYDAQTLYQLEQGELKTITLVPAE